MATGLFLLLKQLSAKPFHISVKINEKGVAGLDHQALASVLPNITDETLLVLCKQAN